VIGIDIEQNGMNSYDGFCCLIQISMFPEDLGSPVKTFIIDVLQEDVRTLIASKIGQRVLENSGIVKILHGGLCSDI
jgi:ribonuclease D